MSEKRVTWRTRAERYHKGYCERMARTGHSEQVPWDELDPDERRAITASLRAAFTLTKEKR